MVIAVLIVVVGVGGHWEEKVDWWFVGCMLMLHHHHHHHHHISWCMHTGNVILTTSPVITNLHHLQDTAEDKTVLCCIYLFDFFEQVVLLGEDRHIPLEVFHLDGWHRRAVIVIQHRRQQQISILHQDWGPANGLKISKKAQKKA